MSIKYSERLAEAGIDPSAGSVGDGYDTALAEIINGLYTRQRSSTKSDHGNQCVKLNGKCSIGSIGITINVCRSQSAT